MEDNRVGDCAVAFRAAVRASAVQRYKAQWADGSTGCYRNTGDALRGFVLDDRPRIPSRALYRLVDGLDYAIRDWRHMALVFRRPIEDEAARPDSRPVSGGCVESQRGALGMKDDNRNHDNQQLDASFIGNPSVSHEESDVRIKPIALFIFWLLVATGVIGVLMVLLFNSFERQEQKAEGKPSPLASERNEIPPAPRLQLAPKDAEQLKQNKPPDIRNDNPIEEMKRLKEEEDQRLSNYIWIDQQKGIVSIPIEDAKRLVIEKGMLQSRPR